MKELTDNQKNFLIDTFFKDDRFPGWRSIAESLVGASHSCIVAGEDCIWKGGVGNFIKLEKAPDLLYCSKYVFDFEGFLSSEWVKEVLLEEIPNKERQLKILEKELKEFETELEDLKSLR